MPESRTPTPHWDSTFCVGVPDPRLAIPSFEILHSVLGFRTTAQLSDSTFRAGAPPLPPGLVLGFYVTCLSSEPAPAQPSGFFVPCRDSGHPAAPRWDPTFRVEVPNSTARPRFGMLRSVPEFWTPPITPTPRFYVPCRSSGPRPAWGLYLPCRSSGSPRRPPCESTPRAGVPGPAAPPDLVSGFYFP